MLGEGSRAPDFRGVNSKGRVLKLSSLRVDMWFYFYLKAMTAGCTRESLGLMSLSKSSDL